MSISLSSGSFYEKLVFVKKFSNFHLLLCTHSNPDYSENLPEILKK